LNGKVYYFGGCKTGSTAFPTDSGYVFDPATGTYDTLPTYPTTVCECCLGVARQNAEIYGLAGLLGDTTLPGYYRLRLGAIHDVSALRIVAPAGDIPLGDTVTPSAWVRNTGTQTEAFQVAMRIDTGYTDRQNVNLHSGDSVQVDFSRWVATHNAVCTAKCSTMLADDGNHVNDTCSEVFNSGTVTIDVRVTSWGRLSDTTDTAVAMTPVLTVHNSGTIPVDFSGILHIAPDYASRESTYGLVPGDSVHLAFASWIPRGRGWWQVCCSLATGDYIRVSAESVFVRVRDAGAVAVVWPRGDFVDSGLTVPRARIRNWGNATEAIPVTFSIFDSLGVISYQNEQDLKLAPGDSGIVSFQPWTAALGEYRARAMTNLAGDKEPVNDTLSNRFRVINGTIGISLSGLYPADTIVWSAPIFPKVIIDNLGTATFDVSALFYILQRETVHVYRSDTTLAIINPGHRDSLTLGPSWHDFPGSYLARAVVFNYAGTVHDTLSGYFEVVTNGVEEPSSELAPKVFALDVPSPNPSRDPVTIRYALPKTSELILRVYDPAGQVVRTLVDTKREAGRHSAIWNREDDRGRKLSAGIYLIRLKTPGFERTRKVVITQ